jgi:phthiocerol/phenolphthiocerol synthesis type-I polyketide synthase E
VTATATVLADIWAQVLDADAIGADDNFFDLGGDSFRATKLVLRVRREWDIIFNMDAVIDAPALDQMAARIDELSGQR